MAIVASSLLLAANSASADNDFFYDCDAPNGRSSVWSGPANAANLTRVHGTIRIVEKRGTARWWPVTSVVFEDEGGTQIGLQLYVDPKEPDKLQIVVHAEEEMNLAPISLPTPNESVAFALSISEPGDMRVEIAEESQTVELTGFQVDRVRLSCSSGQFKIDYSVVGT